MIQEQLLGGDAFEDPYDLADAVFGMEAYQQMNVVLVIAELLDDKSYRSSMPFIVSRRVATVSALNKALRYFTGKTRW